VGKSISERVGKQKIARKMKYDSILNAAEKSSGKIIKFCLCLIYLTLPLPLPLEFSAALRIESYFIWP
jgi:hypothetical protein